MKRILFMILLLSLIASAQVDTSTPKYAPIGGGPFDQINLANLNVHFTIPILHKDGRGLPLDYVLTYDTAIWRPVTSGSTIQWNPSPTWGWSGSTQGSVGYFDISTTTDTCWSDNFQAYLNYDRITYNNYYDSLNRPHGINVTVWNEPCTGTGNDNIGLTAADGSGLQFKIAIAGSTVQTPDGTLIAPPVSATGAASMRDRNGNRINIAYNSSNGERTFTDTLGSTDKPALKISGAGNAASPTVFTYYDSTGTARTITIHYTHVTVATNFGCTTSPQVAEYGQSLDKSADLVTSIDFPNGTYSFQYETISLQAGVQRQAVFPRSPFPPADRSITPTQR